MTLSFLLSTTRAKWNENMWGAQRAPYYIYEEKYYGNRLQQHFESSKDRVSDARKSGEA
jgi:hypothetical protein